MDERPKLIGSELPLVERLRKMKGMGDYQLAALMDGVGPQAVDEIERLRAELALVRTQQVPAVPEGWKLVPEYPAKQQIIEGDNRLGHCRFADEPAGSFAMHPDGGILAVAVYKAMLDAAPQPPASKDDEPPAADYSFWLEPSSVAQPPSFTWKMDALAASQAREEKLRDALKAFSGDPAYYGELWSVRSQMVREALALPTDDTALRERLALERERVVEFIRNNYQDNTIATLCAGIEALGGK